MKELKLRILELLDVAARSSPESIKWMTRNPIQSKGRSNELSAYGA